jgi:riboflavin kinase/FMN adenylyltransferase
MQGDEPARGRERSSTVQRWQGLSDVPEGWGRSVVTIGVFDGVHLGHRRIVATAIEAARRFGLPVVVITFEPHPSEVIRPGSHPPLLCTVRRRAQLLAGLGADAVCVLPFTLEFSRLEPDEFVRTVLVERLHARWVVVGENFRFGHRAKGDIALLAELGEKYDFGAEAAPLLAEDGAQITVSSSVIRDHLAAGDVEGAARDLGRPHRVEGVVVRGHRRGRTLGYPTANLRTVPQAAIPADAVYAGWLLVLDDEGLEAERWPAAISVGTNPTFEGRQRVVEAYALDRDDLDLYGVQVAVDFAARLRGMEKFGTVEALTGQMRRDVDQARELVAGQAG